MWSGEAPDARRRRRRGEAGFTIIEIAVVIAFTITAFLVFQAIFGSTTTAERQVAATRLTTERGQRVALEVREAVASSRKLFQDDDLGRGYLEALDLSRAPIVSTARLPRLDDGAVLAPDEPGDPRTGNVLLFVQEGKSVSAVSDSATKARRQIDTYRFVCVYPSPSTRTLVVGDGPALDLVVWRSAQIPSRGQILAISDADERASVVADLVDRYGFDRAWDPGAPAEDAFYGLDSSGTMDSTSLDEPTIAEDVTCGWCGRLVRGGTQLARTRLDCLTRRPVLGVDDPAEWAPDGFEVKVAGASGSRRVWIHLVLESPTGRASVLQQNTVIAGARDF